MRLFCIALITPVNIVGLFSVHGFSCNSLDQFPTFLQRHFDRLVHVVVLVFAKTSAEDYVLLLINQILILLPLSIFYSELSTC